MAKSLEVFATHHRPSYSVRTTLADYGESGDLTEVPPFAAEEIPEIVAERFGLTDAH